MNNTNDGKETNMMNAIESKSINSSSSSSSSSHKKTKKKDNKTKKRKAEALENEQEPETSGNSIANANEELKEKMEEIALQMGQMREQQEQQEQSVKKLRNSQEEFSMQLRNLRSDLDKQGKELRGIRCAFSPATHWAMMEEVVYKTVQKNIDKSRVKLEEKELTYLQYALSKLAGHLLSSVVRGDDNFDTIKKSVGTKILNKLRDSDFSCRNTIISSLTVFVRGTDQAIFKLWPPERNPLMHDGKMLDAFYGEDSVETSIDDNFGDRTKICEWRKNVSGVEAVDGTELVELLFQVFDQKGVTTSWKQANLEEWWNRNQNE